MKILKVWDDSTDTVLDLNSISVEDRQAVLDIHRTALKNDLFWEMFGGVITLGGRSYQVMATNEELAA